MVLIWNEISEHQETSRFCILAKKAPCLGDYNQSVIPFIYAKANNEENCRYRLPGVFIDIL